MTSVIGGVELRRSLEGTVERLLKQALQKSHTTGGFDLYRSPNGKGDSYAVDGRGIYKYWAESTKGRKVTRNMLVDPKEFLEWLGSESEHVQKQVCDKIYGYIQKPKNADYGSGYRAIPSREL